MDIQDAIDRINQHPDLSAQEGRNGIDVSRFGRPAGYVTEEDLENLGHTPTGWGKNLRKGALPVWQQLTQ